jgi:hypothetical protein
VHVISSQNIDVPLENILQYSAAASGPAAYCGMFALVGNTRQSLGQVLSDSRQIFRAILLLDAIH